MARADSFSCARAGAWLIHVVFILLSIVLLDIIPGMTQDLTWTTVNLGYLTVSPPWSSSGAHPGPGKLTSSLAAGLVHRVPLRDGRAI